MIDFAIRQILKLVRRRSRFALLVEIKDSPRGPEYLFTCRGFTNPVEASIALERVAEHISGDIEGEAVRRLLEEVSK